ncbi:TRAP transporter substrate-binding protein DctP [Chloroflexota bacterium]
MKNRSVFVLLSMCVVLILATLSFTIGCGKPEPAGPIELRAVGFLPENHPNTQQWLRFHKMIEEESNGELIVNYLGGGEVISFMDAPLALLEGPEGGFDMILSGAAFVKALVPEAMTLEMSDITQQEEHDSGYVKLVQDAHEKAGFYFVGRSTPNTGARFHLFTNKPAAKLADLKGFKISTLMMLSVPLEELGMSQINMPSAEVYSALERGVADGYIGGIDGVYPRGFHEVLEVCIDHQFLTNGMTTLMSMEGWNQIPKRLQDKLVSAQMRYESWVIEGVIKEDARQRQLLVDAGIKFIKLSPDEAETLVNAFYRANYNLVMETAPELGPKMLELIYKK